MYLLMCAGRCISYACKGFAASMGYCIQYLFVKDIDIRPTIRLTKDREVRLKPNHLTDIVYMTNPSTHPWHNMCARSVVRTP